MTKKIEYKPHGVVLFHPLAIQCNTCINFLGDGKCKAFPNGIPKELITTEYTHKEEYEGDNGIRYELKPYSSPRWWLAGETCQCEDCKQYLLS